MLFFECDPDNVENIKIMFYSSIVELLIDNKLDKSKIMVIRELLKKNERYFDKILKSLLEEPNLNEFYKEFIMDYEKYFVIFIKNSDSSKILIECVPEDKLISLYNYSIESLLMNSPL